MSDTLNFVLAKPNEAADRIEALEAALRVIIKVKGADPWIDIEAIQAIARTALAGGQDT